MIETPGAGQRSRDFFYRPCGNNSAFSRSAGGQFGDFTDLFGGDPAPRRAAAQAPVIAAMGGAAFVLPDPVYGAIVAGGWDQVFPADKRWTDLPAPAKK